MGTGQAPCGAQRTIVDSAWEHLGWGLRMGRRTSTSSVCEWVRDCEWHAPAVPHVEKRGLRATSSADRYKPIFALSPHRHVSCCRDSRVTRVYTASLGIPS